MLLIGFGNKARHGKDAAAEAIVDHFKYENELKRRHGLIRGPGTKIGVFKFATALYQEVSDYIGRYASTEECFGTIQNGVPRPWLPGASGPIEIPKWVTIGDPTPSAMAPYGKHPKLLQWWGTEYRRAQDPDYWVNKLFASIPKDTNIALVTDVRFSNEADSITSRGGYNVNVTRLNKDGSEYRASDRPEDHPSETALDNYNWSFRLINHDGHQALLEEQAVTLTEYLRGLK